MKSKGYHSWIHKFGILSSLFLFAAMTAFPIAASVIYGKWPDFKQLWPGFVAVILFMAPYWPGETIGYMSVMGPGALYMSYITGNVTNLRMPATVGTINSLGIKPNTDECHTMAIIACGGFHYHNSCNCCIGRCDCCATCTGIRISGFKTSI